MDILKTLFRKFKIPIKNNDEPIFFAQQLNRELKKTGYVTLPWLSDTEISRLKTIVANINQKANMNDVHIKTGFMLSAFNNGEAYKRELYETIYPLLKPKIDVLLNDYIPLLINVFEKEAVKANNEVDVHQNPSFVDETLHHSVSIWIPLQNVHKNNGTVGVLKGSHRKFFPIRASNMPMVYDEITPNLVQHWFRPINLKAGEIAILDDSIIHWSYPNYSEPLRTAIQLIMVPKKAEHIYYYYNHDDQKPAVQMFKVNPEYFFRFNRNGFPHGLEKIAEKPYKYYQITEKELLKKVHI